MIRSKENFIHVWSGNL